MKVTKLQTVEFIQFCKYVLAYAALFTIVNIVLISKEFSLDLVLTSALPAIFSYFAFKFINKA